jgi:hypothetical protein
MLSTMEAMRSPIECAATKSEKEFAMKWEKRFCTGVRNQAYDGVREEQRDDVGCEGFACVEQLASSAARSRVLSLKYSVFTDVLICINFINFRPNITQLIIS